MNIQYMYHHVAIQTGAEETVSALGYKTLCQGDMPGCIRPYSVIRDGGHRLLYSTGSMVSLQSRFSFAPEERQQLARTVLGTFAHVLRTIEEKSFLEKAFLVVNPEFIFVKPENGEVCFLIVPLGSGDAQEQYYVWGESVSALVRRLTDSGSKWHEAADASSEGLKRGDSIPLERMLEDIATLAGDARCVKSGIDAAVGELELRCENKDGSVAFFIRKPEFVIGKDAQTDGVIEHNQAVSRRHCVIRRHTEGWFVADLASTNHTYLDGRKLLPDEELPLRDGSTLRIADMGFRVTIR